MGPLRLVTGPLSGIAYCNKILKDAIPKLQRKVPKRMIFQQDGAPCHTSQVSMEYLQQKKVRVMDWPANSPDMSPIDMCGRNSSRKCGNRSLLPRHSCGRQHRLLGRLLTQLLSKHCQNLSPDGFKHSKTPVVSIPITEQTVHHFGMQVIS